MSEHRQNGFTLIELSIVLVIIGLLIGSVLAGKDLIESARIRSQISQIEKYRTAVNTFLAKYNHLPGDIPDPIASSVGLSSRGVLHGQGDGNGLIESSAPSSFCGTGENVGETVTFWVDLSKAKLLDGDFSMGNPTIPVQIASTEILLDSSPALGDLFPRGKLSQTYVYVYGGGKTSWGNFNDWQSDGANYFSLSRIGLVQTSMGGKVYGASLGGQVGVTVLQAFNIDTKMDDGMPMTGSVIAQYLGAFNGAGGCIGPTGGPEGSNDYLPNGGVQSQVPPTSDTCWDNGNVAGAPMRYTVSNANSNNCGLSFRF